MHWTKKYEGELTAFYSKTDTIIEKIGQLPKNPAAENLLADVFIRLTRRLEKVFYGGDGSPLPELEEGINWLSSEIDLICVDFDDNQYREQIVSGVGGNGDLSQRSESVKKENYEAIGEATGEYYATFFSQYSEFQYQEAAGFVHQRLSKNGLDNSWFKGKEGLDAGCGSGRYTITYAQLGAKKVIGLDSGKEALGAGKKAAEMLKVSNVHFVSGDVLNIDFEDESFDFVLSNGVLHHTIDLKRGLNEILRVLKKDGYVWLQLYGDSLFWRINDVFRELAKYAPYKIISTRMKEMGYPPNRIFIYLDNSHVPICNTYYWKDIEEMVEGMGFAVDKRLLRDVQTDQFVYDNEQIYQKFPYADLRWGEGSIKLLLKKK